MDKEAKEIYHRFINYEWNDISKKKHCIGCETKVDKVSNIHGVELCDSCNNTYDNKTGYCSLNCCLGYGCDESC